MCQSHRARRGPGGDLGDQHPVEVPVFGNGSAEINDDIKLKETDSDQELLTILAKLKMNIETGRHGKIIVR